MPLEFHIAEPRAGSLRSNQQYLTASEIFSCTVTTSQRRAARARTYISNSQGHTRHSRRAS